MSKARVSFAQKKLERQGVTETGQPPSFQGRPLQKLFVAMYARGNW